MTRATLLLGPKEQPNKRIPVQVLYELVGLPSGRYYVRSLTSDQTYIVFKAQLTDIVTTQES